MAGPFEHTATGVLGHKRPSMLHNQLLLRVGPLLACCGAGQASEIIVKTRGILDLDLDLFLYQDKA